MKKLNVALIFGGKSQEHEASIASAANIFKALSPNKRYRIIPIGITKDGAWYMGAHILRRFAQSDITGLKPVVLLPNASGELLIFKSRSKIDRLKIDVAFPWVIGSNGEDGSMQGLLQLANIPYVGCGIFASAAGFNKVLTKRVLESAGIPQVPYLSFNRDAWKKSETKWLRTIASTIKFPCFVKPASSGSSVGISKVRDAKSLKKAINAAFQFDHEALIEMAVPNLKEIECAVLGGKKLTVSVPGEVHYEGDFYSFRAKYLSSTWSVDIPPKLPPATIQKVRTLAETIFRTLDASGIARVDFLMNGKNGKIYFNEINTFPTFRPGGCYATLMLNMGISYAQICERLIEVAFEQFKVRQVKQASFKSGSDWLIEETRGT